MVDLFFQALLFSFILLGIHASFGLEIVRRGIIFVDIAVAQFAAVGLALSILIFHEPSYLMAFVFSLFAGMLVALSQVKKEFAEAFIGLLYALGFSSVVLILSQTPHGMEEFLQLTAGDILFVSKKEILISGMLYAAIGFLLYLRRYLRNELLREVSFFTLFSITVTSSVKLVGVLIVFSILVAPALVANLLGKGLLFAWVYGALVNTLGILISFKLDLPTGFTLVFFHALTGILVFLTTLKKSVS
ncbi:metal ABC transporter permease [Aquifex aeolicus]|uniref:Metal ABC transporter permease n=1 Tax=Aquifex aeolicus (strain VF5) TaxID=224324 RepID=O67916_AQUAE|nr:metal ABC transporter permease [Aquifex aeolicus]AAC07888.1 putative protein [Aquifex aeolicus VF5]